MGASLSQNADNRSARNYDSVLAMIDFACHVCHAALSAEDQQAGQQVRCPTCRTVLNVPVPQKAAVGASIGGMAPLRPMVSPRSGGRRYGFNCGYCSSRLEAVESMAAQEGQCPTCGNQITIPILDRQGRLIDPKTRQIIKQDPHPVHAYAAAGERAPRIVRTDAGNQTIICPRCNAASPISANNCKSCGMPFTMEGTTLEAAGAANGFCVASLVLGIVSLPAFFAVIPELLAIIFGIVGLRQVLRPDGNGGSGRGMAIAGIVCGGISGLTFAYFSHIL
jgi:DNA-directed RNA polymerase subunit RPC12/RpoP